ncbi:MAG: NAD(P)-binding domain-containing protein [Candidatus Methylomirabilis sp.]|nr:NAD(P)-binding domain-containing protein [Deltaproteobacteria bacterium]
MAKPGARVAVIGAGSSGIAAAKVCLDHGLEPVVYERDAEIGGNWTYRDRPGHSSVYWSTYINTSKQLMAYSDFEMPDEFPDYPHHTHIARYFNDYVDHFKFRDRIRFGVSVEDLRPEGGGWIVASSDGKRERYDAVMVANGHHWDPNLPEFPGAFAGETLHSHFYKRPEPYADRRVLIVGLGNSGIDIATELSRVAADVAVAMRRGVRIWPKYVAGVPLDHQGVDPISWAIGRLLPRAFLWRLFNRMVEKHQGDVTRFGLPAPTQKINATHPTISSEFLVRVGHGTVRIKPNVQRLGGDHVVFADGSREPFDVVIYATGYKIAFPFLRPEVFESKGNRVRLYKYVVDPRNPGLFFIGLIQPLGAIMPIAEMQSKWVCRLLTGASALPTPAEMEADIDRVEAEQRRRYVDTARHTIQVDQDVYMLDLWRRMVPPGPWGKTLARLRVVDPFTVIMWGRQWKARRKMARR